MAISDKDRLREEDPFTGEWTHVAPTRIIGLHSRFEVDLNRPRDKAVYIKPEDAWGLQVWATEPPLDIIENSRAQYDAFYRDIDQLIEDKIAQEGRFFLFDLHTYGHRRDGPANPEVNIGTGTIDRDRWGHVVDRFIEHLRAVDFQGRHLDVRENIKFKGGKFSRHINEKYGAHGLSVAIEYK